MTQTPATPPPAGGDGKDESLLDKVKDVAEDLKEKGEELIDKVKDKLDGDDKDKPATPDAKH